MNDDGPSPQRGSPPRSGRASPKSPTNGGSLPPLRCGLYRPPNAPPPSYVKPASPNRRVNGASTRLMTRPRRAELPEIDRGKKLEAKQQEEMARRLCDTEISTRQQKHSDKEKRLDQQVKQAASTRAPLAEAEEEDLLQRIYHKQRDHDKDHFKKLSNKWRPQPETHKFTADEQLASNARIYTDRKDHRSEVREALRKKYIHDVRPQFPKITAAQLEEVSKRLYNV